jgi:lysozyme family protein
MSNFFNCLKIVLKHEGGYVNHPRDPGGMTNLGITKRVYEAWINRPATEQEMRALVPDTVAPIYLEKYWKPLKADSLQHGVDLVVFDFGVNAGIHRAAVFAQSIAGVKADGLIGSKSLAAINAIEPYKFILEYEQKRLEHYRSLSTYSVFGKGWESRTRDTTRTALSMIV